MQAAVKGQFRIPPAQIAMCVLLLLIGGIAFVGAYQRSVSGVYAAAADQASHVAAAYDRELAARSDFVAALGGAMQRQLAHGDGTALRLRRSAKGYVSSTQLGADGTPIGRVTGAGPAPAVGTALRSEMASALELLPICDVVLTRNPDMPWCYYLSSSRFLVLFPFSDASETAFNDRMLEADFFQLATPARNPERTTVWTSLYQDLAGKGWMTTVSQPVYVEGRFRGVASIDLHLSTLAAVARRLNIPLAQTALFDADGHPMQGASGALTPAQWRALTAGEAVDLGDRHVSAVRIPASGWWVLATTDVMDAHRSALAAVMPQTLIGALLLVSLWLVLLLAHAWRRVRELAVRDGLTNLFNRRQFDALAQQEFAHVRRGGGLLGLAIIDIDEFKAYNDSNGHAAGDRALRDVAAALTSALRRRTDLLFRIGGEEFALLIALRGEDSLPAALDRVLEAVRALNIAHPGSTAGHITVSIGAVTVDGTGSLDLAYRTADSALYDAKRHGRDRAVIAEAATV